MDKKMYGKLLVTLRKKEQISQKGFAENLNVSAPAVCKWEKGETLPSEDMQLQIADYFHIPAEEMSNPEKLLASLSAGDSPVHLQDMSIQEEADISQNHLPENTKGSQNEIVTENLIGSDILPNRRKRKLTLAIIFTVLIVLICVSAVYKLFIQQELQEEPTIVRTYEQYVDDPSYGLVYEIVYIMNKIPDDEWIETNEAEMIAYLLEADLSTNTVKFSYYDNETAPEETDSAEGIYSYFFLNVITGKS